MRGLKLTAFLCALAWSGETFAQRLDVRPPPRDGFGSSCIVAGLNPRGDNFLAFRSGPSTRYRKVGEVYNGDIINMDRPCPNRNWCYTDRVYRNGSLVGLRGYFYTRYCPLVGG